MELKELYEKIEEVGCFSFSTMGNNGEIHSRIAHFNGYDQGGLYFRTSSVKPYYRQLMSSMKVTVCGMTDSRVLGHAEDGTPIFPPTYTLRIIGEIENVSDDVIREKAKTNEMLVTAVRDIEKYPKMSGANFCINKFKCEIFDIDFTGKRDHKLERLRFSFGGMTYNEAGPRINENCVKCGKCKKNCSFKAIDITDEGKYLVNPSRCNDCGDCHIACKFSAIDESVQF